MFYHQFTHEICPRILVNIISLMQAVVTSLINWYDLPFNRTNSRFCKPKETWFWIHASLSYFASCFKFSETNYYHCLVPLALHFLSLHFFICSYWFHLSSLFLIPTFLLYCSILLTLGKSLEEIHLGWRTKSFYSLTSNLTACSNIIRTWQC